MYNLNEQDFEDLADEVADQEQEVFQFRCIEQYYPEERSYE